MFAVHCGTDVQFNGGKPSTFRSSEWAERGFCSGCGTHLFYHLLQSNEYILPAGLFPRSVVKASAFAEPWDARISSGNS